MYKIGNIKKNVKYLYKFILILYLNYTQLVITLNVIL